METRKILAIVVLALGLMVCQANMSEAADIGSAFTYQGRLLDVNSPADGLYDFTFMLYDSNDPCDLMAGPIEVNDLDVIEGYFTAELDFGEVFDGNDLWLEIGVRPGELAEPEDYTFLNPLVELMPAPHAIYAKIAGRDGDWMVSGDDMYSIPSGNVGIGTTGPNAKLTINDNIAGVGPGVPGIMIGNDGTSAIWLGTDSDDMGEIGWLDGEGGYLRILSDSYIHFGVGPYTSQPDVIFTASGDVGIGTSSPSHKLNVIGDANITGSLYAGTGSTVLFVDDTTDRVGIGTTSPNAKVTINDNITDIMPGVPGLMIGNNGNSAIWVGKDSDNYGAFEWINPYVRIWSENEVRFALGGQQDKIVFDSSGNVGIGTPAPSYKLEVNGASYANTVDTGQGNYELYAMNQNVRTSDGVSFATVNTGHGDNELYAMNQNVRTSDGVSFATVNTGQGDNELYAMNQNVRTSDNTTFNRVHIADYGTALGGFHVGGTSDPGTDNLTVDSQIYVPNMDNAAVATAYEVLWQSDKLVKGSVSSSSARYKQDIRPLRDDFYGILQAQCRSFTFKENGQEAIGFIAEEFDALGLDNLVIYRDGRPDGIKYDMVPLYLLEVLKDQTQTTEQLKAENESLTERVEALERSVQQLVKAKEVQL